ncbi:hypothetical protein [Xenorhabdus sp. Sc-CR9]|uniref:hypothetical protein n=1 Tax=Xenorhabdus sp. Sc-CR9 TaxID=2584468 RepID=UPI001F3C8563|nr:hypothetical protein [Xenorhabdus sp. Sc-CR9]
MKFEELTPESQQVARGVLSNLIRADFHDKGEIDSKRAEQLAHQIRNAFAALEGDDEPLDICMD